MGVIQGMNLARALAIEAATIISGAVVGDNLILTKNGGGTVNAGNVRGAAGATPNIRRYLEKAKCNAAVPLTTVDHDIPGATLTVPVVATTDVYLVTGVFDFLATVTGGNTTAGDLVVNGVKQSAEGRILFNPAGLASIRGSFAQTWRVTGLAAGNRIFKLTGDRIAGSNAVTVGATHSAITVQLVDYE